MNVAIYARVSKAGGLQDPDNQLHELRGHVGQHKDWKLAKEYVDYMSGAKETRPEFLRMLRDAANPRRLIDTVLVWSLDRFSREGTMETHRYMETLAKLNVGFMSYKEPYIDTCGIFRDVIISLLATLAKQERMRLSERTKAGMARAKRAGATFGRRPVNLNEKIVRKLVASGLSVTEVAQAMKTSRSSAHRAMVKIKGNTE